MATLRARTPAEQHDIIGIQHDTKTGNFSDQAINFALHHLLKISNGGDNDRVCLVPPHSSRDAITPGSTKHKVLSRQPPGHQEFNLAWYGGKDVHEGNDGHAMCLRCVNGQWYRTNSETTYFPDGTEIGHAAAPMQDGDWGLLRGTMQILAEGIEG